VKCHAEKPELNLGATTDRALGKYQIPHGATEYKELKLVHPLKLYQHTKFHGPTLTGVSFASTLEVCAPDILVWLKQPN
jgi:hypothetical protein